MHIQIGLLASTLIEVAQDEEFGGDLTDIAAALDLIANVSEEIGEDAQADLISTIADIIASGEDLETIFTTDPANPSIS